MNVNSTIFKEQLTNISAVLNNTTNTTKLLTSFGALDVAQQKVLLSSKLLTEEQKVQCATMATLTSANAKYTAEQIAKATGVSAETLANWGLIKSTDTLTISELAEKAASDAQAKSVLEKIIAQNAQAVANGEVTASNVTLATSEGGATLATGAFTTAIKANIKAMWTWMTTTPVGWITMLVGGVLGAVTAYNALTDSVEETKEKAEDLISTYKTVLDTANSHKESIDNIADRYEELSKGVNNLGENVSLTAEEYQEYNSIVNDIAEMFPTMVQGYTDEGNAILKLKGNVDALREAYEAEAQAAYNSLISTGKDSDGNDILKDANNVITGSTLGAHDWGNVEKIDYLDKLMDATDSVDSMLNLWDESLNSAYSEWFEDFAGVGGTINIGKLTDEDLANIRKNAKILKQQYQAEIDSAVDNAETLANAYLMTNEDYAKLDEQSKNAASIMVNSLNANIVSKFGEDKENVGKYVDDIVQIISTNPDAKDAMIGLFTMDTTDMPVDDIEYWTNAYIDTIAKILQEDPAELRIRLGFDNDTTEPLKTKVQGFLNDEFDSKVGELTLEELEIATSRLEIPEGTLLSWDEFIAKLEEAKKLTPNNAFTDTISQVQSLTEGLDKLDQIYADVLDKESFDWSSILNNKGFKETFGGLGATYDDFIKTISNSPNDIDACQSAFDNLATAYIQNSDVLSDLTEETKKASIAMLEEMGIKNAEEVVTSILIQKEGELAAQKILAANSTYTLTNLTTAEIDRLLTEGIVTEQTSKQLAIFALQKQLSNNYRIETQEDVNRIYNLAQMAGIGAEALAKFAQFKNDLENETDPRTRSWIVKSINEYKATLFSELNDVKNSKFEIPEVSYGGGSATKSALDNANKAAEDNKVKFKEILDKYLELYKAELDAGLIDFKTFLNKSRSLLDEYYRDGKISGKEYWDYIGNLQKEQLSVYDKVLSAVTKLYDDEIDKINDIIDGLEKQNDALKDQLEQYDNVLGVVDKVYESEIDRIRKQQDAIDETISKLQDENDEKQRAIELEKARYQLYRALNNRTVKLYNGKEYIYTHDRDEVRDAQQNLADLELEETVAGLEKEKETLNEVIAELEKYREMWKEISSAKEDEEYKQLAIAIWGKDYEKIILSNRITDIDSFKDKYIHIQQQIEDNQGLIDSYNEKIEYYEALKEAWNSVATSREESINREMAAQTLGANWENDVLNGRMDVLNNFKNMYIATQQSIVDAAWNAANAQIAALNAVKAAESTKSQTSGGSSGSVSGGTQNKPNKPNKKPSHSNSGGGYSNRPSMEKYGTGTDSAKPGTHIVAEDGKEIIRTNDGEMFLAENEQPFRFEGGETVINNSETTTLLENLGNYKPVDFAEFTGSYGNKFKIRQTDLTALFDLSMNRINTSLHNSTPVRNDNTSSINIGDIHLHEVQNVDSLAKAIIRELPGKVNQAICGK